MSTNLEDRLSGLDLPMPDTLVPRIHLTAYGETALMVGALLAAVLFVRRQGRGAAGLPARWPITRCPSPSRTSLRSSRTCPSSSDSDRPL